MGRREAYNADSTGNRNAQRSHIGGTSDGSSMPEGLRAHGGSTSPNGINPSSRGAGNARDRGAMSGVPVGISGASGERMMTDRATQQEVAQLRRDLEAIARHVEIPSRTEGAGSAIRDQMWKCKSCGSLLGFYDPDKDMMRVKYKDLVLFARAGGMNPTKLEHALISACEHSGVFLDDQAISSFIESIQGAADFGFIQILCRGCAAINTIEYSPETAEETEAK